jgi:hypothetical protein
MSPKRLAEAQGHRQAMANKSGWILIGSVHNKIQVKPATLAMKDFCHFFKKIETSTGHLSTCGCNCLQTLLGADRVSIHRKIYPGK